MSNKKKWQRFTKPEEEPSRRVVTSRGRAGSRIEGKAKLVTKKFGEIDLVGMGKLDPITRKKIEIEKLDVGGSGAEAAEGDLLVMFPEGPVLVCVEAHGDFPRKFVTIPVEYVRWHLDVGSRSWRLTISEFETVKFAVSSAQFVIPVRDFQAARL